MNGSKTCFVIFGGTGDLTYRKLIPAFYDLYVLGKLNPLEFEVIVIGRRDYNNEIYRDSYEENLLKYARFKNQEHVVGFRELITYYKMDFNDASHYADFKQYLFDRGKKALFYLAVSPESFTTIGEHLAESGILAELESKQLLIEKPFGEHLESAKHIDEQIKHCFKESEIYRIDHYLAKEMVINILTIRFGNKAFETLWNRESIENIQISALEEGGVNERGNYYDHTGALEDMFQSHLLQVLSYVLMERPKSMDPKHLHKAQEKALNSLKFSKKDFNQNFIRGQYTANADAKGYLEEKYIASDSQTETFVALKLSSNDKRFKDVPIYVRTGKRMKSQSTYVAITFKPEMGIDGQEKDSNILIIRIGPDEGIYFKVNIKKPGHSNVTQPVTMDFCQSCIYENRLNTPQAYERLIEHAIDKDKTLFTSWPVALKSWELTEQLQKESQFNNNVVIDYPANTYGPEASDQMLAKEGHQWVEDIIVPQYDYE